MFGVLQSIFAQTKKINEISIYNSLLGDLYSIGSCQNVIQPPYFACSEYITRNDSFFCGCKSIPNKYKFYCQDCINKEDLINYQLILYFDDTLRTMEFSENKEYLLKKLDENSEFKSLIKNGIKIFKRHFSTDSLQQNKLKIIYSVVNEKKEIEFRKHILDSIYNPKIQIIAHKPFVHKFGKVENKCILGYISLSRICFNDSFDLGIFTYTYFGGYDCGH